MKKILIDDNLKEKVKEQVNYFDTDGNGSFKFDEFTLAVITLPEHNNEKVRISVLPDRMFEDYSSNVLSYATAIRKENPILKSKLDESAIWIKKVIFLQLTQEEFDALVQHELNHIIFKHFDNNRKDERICRLINMEFEPILEKINNKINKGEYILFSDKNTQADSAESVS